MISRLQKKAFLLITFIFAIIGLISVFKYSTTPVDYGPEKETVFASPPDSYFDPDPIDRVYFGHWNEVMCYPSVGGMIINRHVDSVELDFLNLSRFEETPRSPNPDEEDAFCRRLRLTGAKWWGSYSSYDWGIISKMRPISAKEREALVLGWPEHGGVWVIRAKNWVDVSLPAGGMTWTNAYTMAERCKAMERAGAVYYANPEDCDPVKELMDGFGNDEEEPKENYYYDYPDDRWREL